jgi:hypothetical protein
VGPKLRVEDGSQKSSDGSPQNGRRAGATAVSARHTHIGRSWTTRVEALEAVIRRFRPDGPVTNTCEVVFFEIPGDEHLHVNVTHRYATKVVSGWAGPGAIPDGFVHSRTFHNTPQSEIEQHIRDMVFAARTSSRSC